MWKDVKGFAGLYKVNECGEIFSKKSGKILRPNLLPSGYYQYTLWKSGKRKVLLGHRIVADAFLEKPDDCPIINHKNEIKTDNRVANLEWCTQSYNCSYGKMKRIHEQKCFWGNGVEASKKPVNQLKGNHIIASFESISDASKQTGINLSNISQCCMGKRKRAGGYHWEYKEKKNVKA